MERTRRTALVALGLIAVLVGGAVGVSSADRDGAPPSEAGTDAEVPGAIARLEGQVSPETLDAVFPAHRTGGQEPRDLDLGAMLEAATEPASTGGERIVDDELPAPPLHPTPEEQASLDAKVQELSELAERLGTTMHLTGFEDLPVAEREAIVVERVVANEELILETRRAMDELEVLKEDIAR